MRSAGNFNPEWGYLAPAPSFFRTARVVIVAAAVGATAAAGVVLALIERPAAKTEARTELIAAHALVRAVPALPVQASQQPASTAVVSSPAITAPPVQVPLQVQTSAVAPEPVTAAAPVQPPAPEKSVVESSSYDHAPSEMTEARPADAAPPAPAPEQSHAAAATAEAAPASAATAEAADDSVATPAASKKPGKKRQASGNAKARHADDGFGRTLRHFFTAGGGTSFGQGRGLY